MKKRRITPAQLIVVAVSLMFCVWICLPGFVNAGTLLGIMLSAAAALCAVFAPQLGGLLRRVWKRACGKAVLCLAAAVVAAVLGVSAYNAVMMVRYSSMPLSRVNCVMILGCQVHGTEPGGELENRLETALPLIIDNPQVPVIVTGGQGLGEQITEAECMKEWLMERGIDEERIYTEEASTSTAENFANSVPILSRMGISDGIAVVTNDFHQYRAELYARKNGISVGHYPAHTRALVFPNYLIRELAALFVVLPTM